MLSRKLRRSCSSNRRNSRNFTLCCLPEDPDSVIWWLGSHSNTHLPPAEHRAPVASPFGSGSDEQVTSKKEKKPRSCEDCDYSVNNGIQLKFSWPDLVWQFHINANGPGVSSSNAPCQAAFSSLFSPPSLTITFLWWRKPENGLPRKTHGRGFNSVWPAFTLEMSCRLLTLSGGCYAFWCSRARRWQRKCVDGKQRSAFKQIIVRKEINIRAQAGRNMH